MTLGRLILGRRRALLLPLLLAAACSAPGSQSPTARRPLEAPERVLVAPFATLTRSLRPERDVNARVERAVESEPLNKAELRNARAVQSAFQQALVARLRARDLPAAVGGADAEPGRLVLVQGQIISVDRATVTHRRQTAFGAGRSTMIAQVQLFYVVGDAAPQFLDSFEIEPQARPLQGTAARTPAAGGTDIAGLADATADRIAAYAVTQAWLPARR